MTSKNKQSKIIKKRKMGPGFSEMRRRIQTGKTPSKESLKKRSETMKQLYKTNPEMYDIHKGNKYRLGKTRTKEEKDKISNTLKQTYKDHPEILQQMANTKKEIMKDKTKHPNYGKKLKPETIEKIKESWTEDRKEYQSELATIQLQNQRNFKNTNIELIIQNILDKENIKYIIQKSFKIGRRSHPVDIFIEPNICIECDGDYWHNYPIGTDRDHLVNEELKKQGKIVLRFWGSEIKKNPIECLNKIKEVMLE